jgi:hypothetical protein
MTIKKTTLALAAAAMLVAPIAASAEPAPSYASQDEQIRGTIASIGGKYTVYVRDQRGYVDTVSLHDGTIINPTGLTLAPGQSVTVLGRSDGRAFDANEIDTPYNVDDGDGYAAVDVAPYPYYDSYPAYALSYPAFISLGFGFGGGYYGRGYYGGGYYGRGYYGGYGHGYYGGGYGHGYYGGGYGRGYGGGYGSNENGRRYPQGSRGSSGSSYGHGSYGGSRSGGSRSTTSSAGGGSHGGGHR